VSGLPASQKNWARRKGASDVIIQDLAPFQEARAMEMGATDFCEPQAGLRVRAQATSTSMTAVNADVASDGFAWFSSTIADRVKWWMYHDGAATSGSALRLKKLRLLRMPSGSL
jgi:Zn-dependent alcohol dehydrogenase